MAKFPPEYIPQEYDQEIFQRLMEDVYLKFEQANSDALLTAAELHDKIDESIEQTSTGAGDESSMAPLPVPTGLQVFKIFNLVVAWCNPLEIFKYPGVRGFQFFGSIGDENFTALTESAKVTLTGTHTAVTGDPAWLLRGDSTLSEVIGRKSSYRKFPFYSDMQLNTKSATITNVTQSLVATATATCWDITDPTTICATLTGGSWADQDVYSIDTWMPKNLIGMGVLPLCVAILPFNYGVLNPKWDNLSYFVKVRTYGKSKYSDFATGSSTGYEADAPTGLTVEEIQTGEKPDRTPIYYYYKFGRPYIDVKITWDTIADADSYVVKVFET